MIRDGTIPNTVVELKIQKAGKGAAQQVKRYLMWLHNRLGEDAKEIDVHVYAPGFTSTFDGYIPDRLLQQVDKFDYTNPQQSHLSEDFK
jgi:hypothetical protein